MSDTIIYGCLCSRYIGSLRLGQLQLLNYDVILRPPAWCKKTFFFIEWLWRECYACETI